MRKLMFIVFCVFTFSLLRLNITMAYEKEIGSLSTAMAENIAKADKKRIAVMDFTDLQGNVTELGRFIAEELLVDLLTSAKGFEVIDRTHLKSILAEHKLSISDLVDPNTVKKLGQIVGVDAIITGCVTPLGDSIRVTCKIITTDTARAISAGKGDIAKTKAIEELLTKGIESEGRSTTQPTTISVKPLQYVETENFIFEVLDSKLSGQSLTCNLTVTNKAEQNRHLCIFGRYGSFLSTRIIDDSGNEYVAKTVRFGNENDTNKVRKTMISGVTMKLAFTFKGIKGDTKRIKLLEIVCEAEQPFNAQLRDIPLSR